MKKSRLNNFGLAMLMALTLGVTACANPTTNDDANNSSVNSQTSITEIEHTSSSTTVVPQSVKKLIVSKDPDKIIYEVGEKFDATGLEISVIEVLEGVKLSEKKTTEYTLLANGQPFSEESVIEEGELEIIVKSTTTGIRSTAFTINGVITKQLKTLDAVFDEIRTYNNFTVNTTIGGDNHVKGLVNDDAIIWESDEEAYFADTGYGYGTYEGKTYRYNIINGKFQNAEFIKDLGPKAVDDGLWSSETLDDNADRRISNYNMRGLSKEELDADYNYLKTVKPIEGNANKYLLDNKHVKWLFNLIGHTSLCFSPTYHLGTPDTIAGIKGEVYVEVKNNGLHVELVKIASYAMFEPCSADITNINKTTIPGKRAFLADPIFGITYTNLDVAQDAINANNYMFITPDETKCAIYTQDYVYSKFFEDVNGENVTGLKIKENNNIEKQPGWYSFTLDDAKHKVNLLEKTNADKLLYLTKFDLFANMEKYFKQVGNNKNSFVYDLTPELEATSQLQEILDLFTSATNETVVNSVTLSLVMSGPSIFQMQVRFVLQEGEIDGFDIQQFGQAKDNDIDGYLKSIY